MAAPSLPRAYTLWTRLLGLWDRLAALAAGRRRGHAPARPVRLGAEGLEDRLVPSRPLPDPVIYVGAGATQTPVAKAFDALTGAQTFERTVYDSTFTGGVRVAAADLTGDGFPDLIVAPGPGGGPNLKVIDGHSGDSVPGPLGSFWAFESSFTGGVQVAAADVDGDGVADVIAAAGAGGGPRVRVFSGKTGAVLADFYAFDPAFTGGVTVAAADFDRDGRAELVLGAGPGGGPRVEVVNALTGAPTPGPLGSFFAFDASHTGGVFVGTDTHTADYNNDGTPDLIVGTGAGDPNGVRVFSGADGAVLADFAPFAPSYTGGVVVGLSFVDDDGFADPVVGTAGPGPAATVRCPPSQKSCRLRS